MKKFFAITGLAALSVVGIASCTGGTVANNSAANSGLNRNTGVVTNANNSNSSSNSNSNGSTVGNMANSVANGVTGQVTEGDFFNRAADGGMAEVELSKVALTKVTNPELKKFAQMMVADHTKANTELKALAGTKKIALPTEVGSANKSKLDKLNSLSGADFDKQYASDMSADHDATVSLFESVAGNSAADAETKAWAAKTLPTLKAHQTQIKDIQSKMK